jgi:hypothetical protein
LNSKKKTPMKKPRPRKNYLKKEKGGGRKRKGERKKKRKRKMAGRRKRMGSRRSGNNGNSKRRSKYFVNKQNKIDFYIFLYVINIFINIFFYYNNKLSINMRRIQK